MLKQSASLAVIAACLTFATHAAAADETVAAASPNEVEALIVVGTGQTRSVTTLTPPASKFCRPERVSRRR